MNMRLPARFFKRDPRAHKGDFGRLFIAAGSRRYTGAPCLCARAAMRAGAGLVTLGVPQSLHPIAAIKLTEVMVEPLPETREQSLAFSALGLVKKNCESADVLLIGPGLSCHPQTQELVRAVLADTHLPAVVDADGINALAGHLKILEKKKRPFVLTPHPGEMARLLGLSAEAVQKDRKKIAKDFALRYNNILVLKGHSSIVASPDGKVYENATGNPGMATAGSGDVLAGIIGAFLAQEMAPFEAACCAVWLHGLAGDLAATALTQPAMIASDIITFLPQALKKCRSSSVGRAAVL